MSSCSSFRMDGHGCTHLDIHIHNHTDLHVRAHTLECAHTNMHESCLNLHYSISLYLIREKGPVSQLIPPFPPV